MSKVIIEGSVGIFPESLYTRIGAEETNIRLRPVGFIVTLILLSAPLAADSQQPGKVHRLGVLGNSPTAQARLFEAFRRGLRDLGWKRYRS